MQEKEKHDLEHLGQSLASFGAVRILERQDVAQRLKRFIALPCKGATKARIWKFVYSLEIFKGYKCRVSTVVKQVQLVVLP